MASARIWQPPAGTHDVTIGATMQAALDALDGPASATSLTEYYAVNYDFRPSSLDVRAQGKISATNEPQSDGLPAFKVQYGSSEADNLHAFVGSQSQAKEFECVLIYDEATGEFTFERLDSVITLEYDRASSSHVPASRPLDNSPGSAGTISSGSPPTPPNVNGYDNVQVADFDDLETEETTAVSAKPTPPPSRPTHAAKSVMMVAAPERPAAPAKGKGKRNRDSLAEKDPPARQPPAKRTPAAAAAPPPPPPPALPAAPLALPQRPPTPPSGLRSPNAFVPASTVNFLDDEDDVPLSADPPRAFKDFILEVDENPVLPPPRRVEEEDGPDIDGMFDNDSDDEDGEGEGDEDEDDQDDEDDFRIDVDDVEPAPSGPILSMNDLAGGEDDDDEDDDDDDDDDSDEDSD